MAKFITKTGFIFKEKYHKPGTEVSIVKADKVDTEKLIEKGYIVDAGQAEQTEQKTDGGSGE